MEEQDDSPEMTPEEQAEYEKRINCEHEYKEEYYGHHCHKCGSFHAYGNAPWDYPDYDDDSYGDDDYDEDDEEDEFQYHLDNCGQMPDGSCGLAGTEHCDFECPFRDKPINQA